MENESVAWSNDNTYLSQSSVSQTNKSTNDGPNLSFFIQMEFCENKTLSEFLEKIREPLGDFVAFKMFNDIFQGLQEIHKNNVVHRDLK